MAGLRSAGCCRSSDRHHRAGVLLALLAVLASSAIEARTAFYYGREPPIAEISAYDRVVLDPALVTPDEVARLREQGVVVHAYVSIGEIEDSDPLFDSLPEVALPGTNPAWGTRIADLTHPSWRTFILETRIAPLASWGFNGIFLDTLDSHHLLENPEAQRSSLAELIREIQYRYPDLALMLNRGFEILGMLPMPVAAVAAESLYRGWDASAQTFTEVSVESRRWLLARLEEARRYADEIVVIDYVPPTDQAAREETARKIRAHGFSAWVTGPELKDLGTSDLIPVPRRLVVLHRQKDQLLAERDVHTLFGAVFDWFGYAVTYHDIRDGPPVLIPGVHAGVVTWLSAGETAAVPWLDDLLLDVLGSGIRLVMLASLPTESSRVLERLGIAPVTVGSPPLADRIRQSTALVGEFEAPLRLRRYQVPDIQSTGVNNEPALVIETAADTTATPVLTADWGGVALHPYLVEDFGNGMRRWVLDPYAFIAQALDHRPRPVPDTTTENGSRLLTVHIDGDGFPSRAFLPGSPFSAEVILDEVLNRYDIPHTVSVIEGEIAKTGLYPELAPKLEALARKIFALPNVELASHSYSHPFFWRPELLAQDQTREYGMNLAIEGYRMSLEREIEGSVRYINEQLSPPGKQVEVFLWTGSADPDQRALALVAKLGLVNVNGGNTVEFADRRSVLGVWPQARFENGALQIYAPVMNENVYTNNWTGPFYGYRRVIETFEMTDRPRRLKPISIYYHFYSGTQPAGIRALHQVYDWALNQAVLPVTLSSFARRVMAFQNAWIYRDLDGDWLAGNLGPLRTLRIPASAGYARAEDGSVIGQRTINSDRYVHLAGPEARFKLAPERGEELQLVRANAPVDYWRRGADGSVAMRFTGALPLELSFSAVQRSCTMALPDGRVVPARHADGLHIFELKEETTGDARLVCE